MKKRLLSALLCLAVILSAAAPCLADDPSAEAPETEASASFSDTDLTVVGTLELLTYFCNGSREENAILVYYNSGDVNSTPYLKLYADYAEENGIPLYSYDHKGGQLDYFFYVSDIYGSVSFPCVLIYNGKNKMMVSDYSVRELSNLYAMLRMVDIEATEPGKSASTMTEEEQARSDKLYDLQQRYPEKKVWTEDNIHKWTDVYVENGSLTGFGSDAFAMLLSDAVFDYGVKAKDIRSFYFEDVRPGYILRFGGTAAPHSVVVLETYSDCVVVAEGDLDGVVHWGRVLFKDEVLQADFLTVRYDPETDEEPLDGAGTVFADVDAGAYYGKAVAWAVNNGITGGNGQNSEGQDVFSPDSVCTRAQVATFLWRAAGCPEPTGEGGIEFADLTQDWYKTAVAWAVENGITNGSAVDAEGRPLFQPDEPCSGASIITFIYRSLYGADASQNDEGAPWYYAAYKWVDEHDLTAGMEFSLNDGCTRADTVTFLYRSDRLAQSGELDAGAETDAETDTETETETETETDTEAETEEP